MGDPLTETQRAFVARYLGADAAGAEGAAPGPSLVALQKARLDWNRTRDRVAAALRDLEAAILEMTRDLPYADEVRANTSRLFAILTHLDTTLIDTLDDAPGAPDATGRAAHHRAARRIVETYVDYLGSEPLFEELDDNPFTPVTVRADLTAALERIGALLA